MFKVPRALQQRSVAVMTLSQVEGVAAEEALWCLLCVSENGGEQAAPSPRLSLLPGSRVRAYGLSARPGVLTVGGGLARNPQMFHTRIRRVGGLLLFHPEHQYFILCYSP